MPLGNGKLCAFPYGGIWEEEVLLGNIIDGAVELIQLLKIQCKERLKVKNYCRKLDINQAIEIVDFESEECSYRREYFISRELNMFFIKFSATERMKEVLISIEEVSRSTKQNKAASVTNKLKLVILDTDGEVRYLGEGKNKIEITQSRQIILGLSSGDYIAEKEKIYQNGYNEIKKLHTACYQKKLHRVNFSLNDVCNTSTIVVTDNIVKDAEKDKVVCAFIHYCRYLLISFYYKKNRNKQGEDEEQVICGLQSSEEFISCLEYIMCMFALNLEECIGKHYMRLMYTDIDLIVMQAIKKNQLQEICVLLERVFQYIDNPQLLYKVFYPCVKRQTKENLRHQIYDVVGMKFYKKLCEKLQLSSSLLEDIKQANKEGEWEGKHQQEEYSNLLIEKEVVERIKNYEIWNPFNLKKQIPYKTAELLIRMIIEEQSGELRLLPELPKVWKNGSLTGVRMDRAKVIEIYWEDSKVIEFIVNEFNEAGV
ncbi:glycoside hydrolase N-terminal domain-containing protein [Anaerosporobacter sp.]|uniref:glycoside hydrolase N-terminal domain-containing protein n=1 Tax=Anaerosporobacter sp. TaxID=1872529 RepID=UPI00286EF481|nr:glycoside hydrolase N-terminal domain-containing protein [Anaerosporobacter sp.]